MRPIHPDEGGITPPTRFPDRLLALQHGGQPVPQGPYDLIAASTSWMADAEGSALMTDVRKPFNDWVNATVALNEAVLRQPDAARTASPATPAWTPTQPMPSLGRFPQKTLSQWMFEGLGARNKLADVTASLHARNVVSEQRTLPTAAYEKVLKNVEGFCYLSTAPGRGLTKLQKGLDMLIFLTCAPTEELTAACSDAAIKTGQDKIANAGVGIPGLLRAAGTGYLTAQAAADPRQVSAAVKELRDRGMAVLKEGAQNFTVGMAISMGLKVGARLATRHPVALVLTAADVAFKIGAVGAFLKSVDELGDLLEKDGMSGFSKYLEPHKQRFVARFRASDQSASGASAAPGSFKMPEIRMPQPRFGQHWDGPAAPAQADPRQPRFDPRPAPDMPGWLD